VTVVVALFAVALLSTRPPATAATPRTDAPALADPPLPDGAIARFGSAAMRATLGSTVLFSPDGKVILAFGGGKVMPSSITGIMVDPDVHFWDMKTRRLLHTMPGTAVAFPADGRHIALTNGASVRVYAWPSVGREPLRELTRPGSTFKHLTFSPDGRRLAAGCLESGRVTLWDVVTGAMVREFPTIGCEWSLEFSPDGTRLATGSNGAGAGLYGVETGRLIRHHPDGRGQARFSPDGTLLAQARNDLHFWDVETGGAKGFLKTGQRMLNFAFSPDGKSIAVSGTRDQLGVWDRAGGEVRWVHPANDQYDSRDEYGVAFSPDGRLVAACNGYMIPGHLVRLWDPETGAELPRSVRDRVRFGTTALSPDGKVLALTIHEATGARPTVDLLDTATGEVIAHLLDGDAVGIIAPQFSPDGRWLAAFNWDRTMIQIWDTARYRPAGRFAVMEADELFFTPDGTRLATFDRGDCRLEVWDFAGQRLAQVPVPAGTLSVAFTPDGRTLVTFSRQYLRLLDPTTGKVRAEYHHGEESVKGRDVIRDWALSPDGRTLAITTVSERLVLREVATGQIRLDVRTDGPRYECRFLSGRVLAVSGRDGAIALHDVRTGAVLHRLEGHNGTSVGLSASADGTRLLSRVYDEDILVWDTSHWAGRPVVPPEGRTDEALWGDLAGDDPASAYRAMWGFVSRPGEAVPFLAGRLIPRGADAPSPGRLKRLIAGLDDGRFATREAASRELLDHGVSVEAALRAALLSGSPEVRQRAGEILRRLHPTVTPGQDRALEVLEQIGTAESAALLRRLADGSEGTPLGEAAALSLGRLRPTGGR